jgi:hypothetical protein
MGEQVPHIPRFEQDPVGEQRSRGCRKEQVRPQQVASRGNAIKLDPRGCDENGKHQDATVVVIGPGATADRRKYDPVRLTYNCSITRGNRTKELRIPRSGRVHDSTDAGSHNIWIRTIAPMAPSSPAP